jgi:hypothetical protein
MGAATSAITTYGLKTLQTNVGLSIETLDQYPSDPDATSIKGSYNTLLSNINKSIIDTSGASVNTIASVQSTYNSEVVSLDQKRDRLLTKIKGYTLNDVLRQVSYGVGMIFAAILLTNHMVGEKWYIQVFYIIAAMIFYPLVLVYCLWDPPVWQTLLFPLVETNIKVPEWLLPFTMIFYPPQSKVLESGNTSKNILRVFTAAVIAFWITGQVLP